LGWRQSLSCVEALGLDTLERYGRSLHDRHVDLHVEHVSDVAAELTYYVERLGAKMVYAIEAFETRVAMIRLTDSGPALLLAQHLHGERPVLIYRVPDLDAAEADLARRGVRFGPRFGFPDGDATELDVPGPQRIAVYQPTRPERATQLEGRKDF
jgi:hypothetical protein